MNEIIQLKITLRYSKPPIWRRILVEKTTNFAQLHQIIQIAMGWEDYHLYEFDVNGRIITVKDEFTKDVFEIDFIESKKVTLKDFISKEKQKFEYVYDFGDTWEHQILVEKFLPRDSKINYPVCIKGKLNCPPEDCGGIWGYYDMLETLNNPKSPERKDLLDWLGGEYDPEYFDLDEINKALASLKR